MATLKVYVGDPVADELIEVSDSQTISEIFQENNVTVNGSIQLNGQNVNVSNLNVPIKNLNVKSNDTLYVVKKLDSAF